MTSDMLSRDEMRRAIAALSEAELLKLERVANWLSSGRSLSADDLLQEAICRALEGVRNCPIDVPILAFLVNVMKSLVSARHKASMVDPIELAAPVSTLSDDGDERDALADVEDRASSPEQLLVEEDSASKMKAAFHRLFEDDAVAELVLLDIFAGLTAEETRADLNLDETTYATIRRRIRRRINQRYPEGWKS
ncbi:hypothetical protein [Dechloromonas sp. H13]|uniref:hypothetical protein n=1 Tax=Dechloromonas sp. H13 TaxID=2570193 RepID=UPI00129194E0|nr:hypothetical protein [Dechloromonas sp. H13]